MSSPPPIDRTQKRNSESQNSNIINDNVQTTTPTNNNNIDTIVPVVTTTIIDTTTTIDNNQSTPTSKTITPTNRKPSTASDILRNDSPLNKYKQMQNDSSNVNKYLPSDSITPTSRTHRNSISNKIDDSST